MEPIVSLAGVRKEYLIAASPTAKLVATLAERLREGRLRRSVFRGLSGRVRRHVAVEDVTFDLYPGETFGIVGRNGSGKSTVLQMIAQVLTPTSGTVRVRAKKVVSMLELGSGFDPELTGVENVHVAGALLGLTPEAMRRALPQIAAFSELERFMEQPVKTYSSGMFVRLAFAVYTAVDPDLVIIDEALAVGDIFFRQKCYRRLRELRSGGTAIMLVSHATSEVEEFCERGLLLNEGKVLHLGTARDCVKRYYLLDRGPAGAKAKRAPVAGDAPPRDVTQPWPEEFARRSLDVSRQQTRGDLVCRGVLITDETGAERHHFHQGEWATFLLEAEAGRDIESYSAGVELVDERGTIVFGKTTLEYGTRLPEPLVAGTIVRFRQRIKLEIASGEYSFNVGFSTIDPETYARRSALTHQELYAQKQPVCIVAGLGPLSVALRPPQEPTQLLHHGVANLPGTCVCEIAPVERVAVPHPGETAVRGA